MKINRIIIIVATLLAFVPVCAQQPEMQDTVAVYGAVSNHNTRNPEPYCTIQFFNNDRLVAGAVCDEEGLFVVDTLPVGTYTLKVLLSGVTLYKQELLIDESANLNISVITDSTTIRMLPEIHVAETAPVHQLEYQELLITSPSDPRLWDFSYRWWVPGPKPVPHEARRDLSELWCAR
ncbi:MAG: hypothetical protein IJ785_08330 [Bacteroidales bacterium]|nr:hypothetical protein [Bacteroidales bacterium]